MPPPLINRLVSSATATPFVPEEKRPTISEIPFSCVVEPPPKRGRARGASDEKPAASALSVVPTTPPSPGTTTPGRVPAVVPNPTLASGRATPQASVPAAPMATMPPFAQGGTTAPFASTSDAPFEFNPEKPPRVRWLSWSTVILIAGCVAGYFQYQRMQEARASTPSLAAGAAAATALTEEKPASPPAPSSVATPFTALKQAKATIKDAGEKHKAAYELVEKMLDDPNAAVDATTKPALAPIMVQTPEPAPDASAKPKRDAVTALLGTDGEFSVPADSPKPTLRFARWVRAVKIGGARLSDNPRVLVGSTAFTFGDVVETNLGIVLDGYNAERRALRFKETATGAVIERRI